MKITNILIILLVLISFTGISSASEFSDYKYLINHQDSVRNVAALNDLAYHYGSMDRLASRMNYVALYYPKITVNAYGKYNSTTQSVEWTGKGID